MSGEKLTLSFRGSKSQQFLYQARIVGSLEVDSDLTAGCVISTSGLMVFFFGREASGWQSLISEMSGESAANVQSQLEQAVLSFKQKIVTEHPILTGAEDLLFSDGIFVTVQSSTGRAHFPLADGNLPTVQHFEQTNDQLGIRIALLLPGGRSLELTIVGADEVLAAERAVTLLRNRSTDQENAPIEFKIPARPDQSKQKESHPLGRELSLDFRNAPGDPATYDVAVGLVYPYLVGTSRITNASREKAYEVSGASHYLARHSKVVRGQGFETLRSLSVSRNSKMMNDPRDSLPAKLVGRALAGRGDDDSSVHRMIDVEVSQLKIDATMRYTQVVLDSDPLSDQHVRDEVSRLFAEDILGRRVPSPVTEEGFSNALDAYKTSIKRSLTSPGVVGNVMASRGSFDLAAMRQADKRNSRGRYSASDLQMIASLAAKYRGVFKVAARLQRAMGWAPSDWDPVDFVIEMGQGR